MSALADSSAARSEHQLGVFLVAASAVAWSVSGIFARLLDIDAWTTVSMRAAIGAIYMAFTFAIVAVIVRARPGLEMLPVNLFCCLLTALAGLPFASPASATPQDWLVLSVFAFTSIPLAFFMFLAGARKIPSAESGLI